MQLTFCDDDGRDYGGFDTYYTCVKMSHSLDQPASINSRFSSVDESGPVSYASWRR